MIFSFLEKVTKHALIENEQDEKYNNSQYEQYNRKNYYTSILESVCKTSMKSAHYCVFLY